MNTNKRSSRLLGAAFLLQAVTSLISGLILMLVLIEPESITESMNNIAANAWLMRTSIIGDVITAIGIIFLGAILFLTLREQDEKIALVALGFYSLEAAILVASKIAAFSLLRISQEFVTAGQPTSLQMIGNLAFESMDFGSKLLMLPFCLGAILFYYLLYKSGIIPRALSLWGLITVSIALVATLFALSGYEVPFFIYLPYAPFEFVAGIWILVKGLREASKTTLHLVPNKVIA